MGTRLLCLQWTYLKCKFVSILVNSCMHFLSRVSSFAYINHRYDRFSHKKGWKFEVVDITESDLKGYKV